MMTWWRENWRLYRIRWEIWSEINGIVNVTSFWVSSWDRGLLVPYLSLINKIFLVAKTVRLVMTEPQYRFWNSMHVVILKLLHFALLHYALEKLLQFALKFLLHFASMLLHFALVLHFAAILITFCVNITFCGDYYILRRNRLLLVGFYCSKHSVD